MRRQLYDLAGAEPERRFSPYCWRIKFALAHKGLEVDTIPWRFTDKKAIAFSGQERVPVLVDGDRVVSDSWKIAAYLEESYPDRPSLFGGPVGLAVTCFVNSWADSIVNTGIVRLLASDILAHLHEKDQAYFRESREKRFGMKLEDVSANRDKRVIEFRQSLEPARITLRAQPYIGGNSPTYADYIILGSFQWARCISNFRLLAPDDILTKWRDRLLNSFDDIVRDMPSYTA